MRSGEALRTDGITCVLGSWAATMSSTRVPTRKMASATDKTPAVHRAGVFAQAVTNDGVET
ncbi:uncharacterized protein PG986_012896 [Apiospora aurea]|uniref:Uncharacterized protein n=1 Tax=Apiospora aurea TaxID=335848 RepID=A0ABR1Q1A6_9PEZI